MSQSQIWRFVGFCSVAPESEAYKKLLRDADRTATNPPLNMTPTPWYPTRPNPNSASLPIYAIDFLHDSLGPLNSRSNERLGSWAWLGIKEVFGRFKVTSDQDSSHYREHSFATLFHDDKLIMFAFCSPIKFVRRNQSARVGCGIQSKGCPRERKYQHRESLLTERMSGSAAENISLLPRCS